MNIEYLMITFVLGVVGLALFVYGKKQRLIVPALGGIVLMGMPYVVHRPVVLGVVGLAIAAGSIVFRSWGE